MFKILEHLPSMAAFYCLHNISRVCSFTNNGGSGGGSGVETGFFHFHEEFSEQSGKNNKKSGKINKSNPPL